MLDFIKSYAISNKYILVLWITAVHAGMTA